MTDINELTAKLKAAAQKATPGEWWSDVVETDGEYGEGEDRVSGFHSYAVYDENNHSLLDMTNSTAACILVEDDGDYVMAWDEVGRRNAEFIVLASPANILALTEALEAAGKQAAQQGNIACELFDEVARLRRNADDKAPELRDQLDEAQSRIAELEARTLTVKLPEPLMPMDNGRGELFMTPDDVEQGGYLNRDDVLRALRKAGIKLQIEGE